MKIKLIIIFLLLIFKTSYAQRISTGVYTAVEPWKEWEIELTLSNDSTFTITDRFGCLRFDYGGMWLFKKDSKTTYLVLIDTIKVEYSSSHNMFQFYNYKSKKLQMVSAENYFPILKFDTVWILNSKQFSYKNLTFTHQGLFSSKDLGKQRTKLLEAYYISKMGKELFIKTFGNGKGIDEARKNISACKINPIPNSKVN